MLFLRCMRADCRTDEKGPYSVLSAHAVRQAEEGVFVTANWWELPEHHTVCGPLGLTRHPGGIVPALTVTDFSCQMVFDGPVFFHLRVYDPAFDPSEIIGGVFAAEGRGGESCQEFHFHCWVSDPDDRPEAWRRLPPRAHRLSLAELDLSAALQNCLEWENISSAADLCLRTAGELLEIRNLTAEFLQESRDRLAVAGLWLRDEGPPLTASAELEQSSSVCSER